MSTPISRTLGALAVLSSALLACRGQLVGDQNSDDSGLESSVDSALVDVATDSSDGANDVDSSLDVVRTDSESDAPTVGCPSGKGPAMVRIDAGSSSFCIDTTEVTVAQYDDFLSDFGGPYDVPTFCTSGSVADTARPPPSSRDLDPAHQRRAASGIGYCQAYGYCKWAGKRLCGKLGGGHEDGSDTSEWVFACQNGARKTIYPYDDSTYDSTACNTETKVADAYTMADVGSFPKCHGMSAPFDRIFDMVGNVAEVVDWTNPEVPLGEPDAAGMAAFTRGNWTSEKSNAKCAMWNSDSLGTGNRLAGVRCCSD